MRAISRRTPSKPDRITAFGVSSMMKSTPVRCSSARMLRPSRPMMRPFMSSAGSWTTDDRRLGGVAGGEALHDDGEDVAHAALGVALGLLLDLADEPGGVVADLVLELLEQELLGLRRGEPGDALERADVALVGLVGLAASCSRSDLLAGVELGGAHGQRLLARHQALLHAPDLLAAGVGVVHLGRVARGLLGGAPCRGRRRAWPGRGEPWGSLDQQRRRDHQAGRKHDRRDHDFHCPCPLSVRRPAGRGEIRCFDFQRRQIGSGPEPGARGSASGRQRLPPRQMAAR